MPKEVLPDSESDTSDEAVQEDTSSALSKAARRIPLPSTNPGTNLLIADIVVRGASTLFRKSVEEQVVKASAENADQARDALDGRSIITTLGLYGASKLATRSVPGLVFVAGGLVAKTLYDHGKEVHKRKRRQKAREAEPPAEDQE